ncbi:MAG: ABC transporter substrate-binding protein [Candidatus Wallbacteria bacterium]|nr:ABC transporter substrate-binding protein [Candidatus Wallbacteria bacterium]
MPMIFSDSRCRVVFCTILFISLLQACGMKTVNPAADTGGPPAYQDDTGSLSYGGTLIQAVSIDAVNLNPVLCMDSYSRAIAARIFDSLVRFNSSMEISACLADTWEMSSDCMSITFGLKRNILWQDGMEFTSADVKFTYEKLLDPMVKSPRRQRFDFIRAIHVPGPYEVRFDFNSPFSTALCRFIMFIIPEHIFSECDFNDNPHNRFPIGTGPYKFVGWDKGDRIILEYFAGCHSGRPFIDQYIIKVIPDQSALFQGLLGGEIDVALMNFDQYLRHASDQDFSAKFNIYRYRPGTGYTFVAYNNRNELFSKEFRRALSLAVDTENIMKDVYHGYASRITGPFASSSQAYDQSIVPLPYSPGEAESILKNCGWTDTDQDGILDRNGKKLSLRFSLSGGSAVTRLLVEAVSSCWRRLGVQVTLEVQEWSDYLKSIRSGEFDMFLLSIETESDPDQSLV